MATSYSLPANAEGSPIVVPTTLADAGAQILAAANVIIEELNTLYNAINGLHGTWSGVAATDYQALQQEWNVAAQGLFGDGGAPGVLGDIAQAMNIVAANYADGEHANILTWAHT
jgi:WXG100 family type VII secretion target